MPQKGQFEGGIDSYARQERATCKLENPRKGIRPKIVQSTTVSENK